MTWGEIASSLGTQAQGTADRGAVGRIWTDTRTASAGDVFFALVGKRYDAHAFLADAAARGVRHFVVSDESAIPPALRRQASWIRVEDTLRAYGTLARAYRSKFPIPCVVVTGSCGKTTVKEMVAQLLGARFRVLKNQGTENNLIGVPKTIFTLTPQHEALVLEIGTSLPGEIARLAEIASPQAAAITRIGAAHLEGLGSLEGVLAEKTGLIPYVSRGGVIVLNGDDPMLAAVSSGVHRIVRCGTAKGSDRAIENVWVHEKGSSFSIGGQRFETELLGRHNVSNAAIAVSVAEALGVDAETSRAALSALKPAPGRAVPRTIEGIQFIDDTYNANPTSFKAALEMLGEFKTHERRKAVICGDMLELGAASEALHRQLGAMLASMTLDRVIAAGDACRALVDEAVKCGLSPKKIEHVKDSVEAGRLCRDWARPGDLVLVKGSRGMQMEKVFECYITSSIR